MRKMLKKLFTSGLVLTLGLTLTSCAAITDAQVCLDYANKVAALLSNAAELDPAAVESFQSDLTALAERASGELKDALLADAAAVPGTSTETATVCAADIQG
jgi:hypothetical protein